MNKSKKILLVFFIITSLITYYSPISSSQQSSNTLASSGTQKLFPPIDDLLSNPQKALDQSIMSIKKYDAISKDKKTLEDMNKCKNIGEFYGILTSMAQEIEKENSIMFLTECQGKKCVLTRSVNPHLRETFEEIVSNNLVNAVETGDEKAQKQYVTFASGYLFNDLIILAKTLSKKPEAHVAVHFIDPLYFIYEQFCPEVQRTPLEKIHFSDLQKQFEPAMIKKYPEKSDALFYMHRRFDEFTSYLNSQFPLAVITAYVYSHSQDYLNCVTSKAIPPADVIAAADNQDFNTPFPIDSTDFLYDYANLCLTTREHNPNSRNTFLSDEDGPTLKEFVSQKPDSKKKTFKSKYKKALHIEVSNQPLHNIKS